MTHAPVFNAYSSSFSRASWRVLGLSASYMTELIDYAINALNRGEYGKAVELIEHIIDSLLAIRPEELAKCTS
jgi:hypothetical protein